MAELGIIEDTLFVPLIGRIYASEHFKKILYDKKALELKQKLPSQMIKNDHQNQYTLIASASRSANMDRFIRKFLEKNPDGIIVQLGCGLETSFYRFENCKNIWYEIDLPNVIEYRKKFLEQDKNEIYLAEDAFCQNWIKKIRADFENSPILIIASGLFYYFEEEKVIWLLKMLCNYGKTQIVFDAVNKTGMLMMQKKYMKQVGHQDAKMFFYVDSANELVKKIGNNAKLLDEEPFYKNIPKSGLKLSTKINMVLSDLFKMVKMIHLELGGGK